MSESATRYCVACGAALPDGATRCGICGTEVAQSPEGAALEWPDATQPVEEAPSDTAGLGGGVALSTRQDPLDGDAPASGNAVSLEKAVPPEETAPFGTAPLVHEAVPLDATVPLDRGAFTADPAHDEGHWSSSGRPAPAPIPPFAGAAPDPRSVDPAVADAADAAPRRRRRRKAPLVIGGAIVALAVGTGGVLAVHALAPSGAAGGGTAAGAAERSASAAAPASGSPASTAASASPAPSASPFAARLSTAQLEALLLSGSELSSGDVSLGSAKTEAQSVTTYIAGYTSTTDPSSCADARGLLAFTGSGNTGTIVRRADLRLPGDALAGEQQVRQFADDAEAEAFMRRQRAWFDRCSTVEYRYGASSSVGYAGAVTDDATPDRLATTGAVSGSPTMKAEFDGWTRVGSVVFAAYLLSDGSADRAELRRAGDSVLDAADRELRAAG